MKLDIILYFTWIFWKCHKTFKFVDTKPCRKINYAILTYEYEDFYTYLITHWELNMKNHLIFYSDF